MQVRFESVTKQFQDKRKRIVTAVDNLSLTIESGKLMGFLGPSGCGKSTSLFIIAGIHHLTSGRIWFDERDVSVLPPEKRGVGMVFQNYALYPHLTVRQNIEFPLVNSKEIKNRLKAELVKEAAYGSMKELVAARVMETAKLVEIEDYLDRKPAELSGGQQQRVAIARAVVKRPSILLLDEPLSNLDARLRVQTREEIKRIQRKIGITTVFVTHDQEEALSICDEILIMKDGLFQQAGNPQEIYDRPANRFVAEFFGGVPMNMLQAHVKNKTLLLGDDELRTEVHLPDGEVSVGIRPESVVPEASGLAVTVREVRRQGGISTAVAELRDGQTICFFQESRHPVTIGQEIKLDFCNDGICIFNQAGEKVFQC
ncbi:MAG: ABC transporter ATP-binding protein [Defluviitaleaceae bacterium]|nr:ABC transporter ATP-binding protein [Defluviitaleaceae bacterium]